MISRNNFKIFDAHLHTYGIFLSPHEDIISYMDHHNVEIELNFTISKKNMLLIWMIEMILANI